MAHLETVPLRELSTLLLPRALEVCALRENINRRYRRVAAASSRCGRLRCARAPSFPSGQTPFLRRTKMLKKETTIETPAAAVETPQAATTLAPEAVVEQLRTLQSQMGELKPL